MRALPRERAADLAALVLHLHLNPQFVPRSLTAAQAREDMPWKREAKRAGAAGAGTAVGVTAAGLASKAAIPTLMSTYGVVVPGVGTIFEAGGTVATVQTLTAATLSWPVVLTAAGVGVSVYAGCRGGQYLLERRANARKLANGMHSEQAAALRARYLAVLKM